MPRGLRRSEPAHPPTGTVVGSTTILAPLEVDPLDPAIIHDGSNPGMKPGVYHDRVQDSRIRETTPSRTTIGRRSRA